MFGKKKLAIDADLYDRVKRISETAGYASPDDFVRHALERELAQFEEAGDEEEIRKRLKGLGYIE